MAFEIRKSYIFLFFILLHVVFWDFSNDKISTLIPGDWEAEWYRLINKIRAYESYQPWAKFFYRVEEMTGLGVYFGMLFFSLLNTCLFVSFAKILEVFDKKYGVIAAIVVLGFPSSVATLLMMYKDNFAYLAITLLLFIVARIFANEPLRLSKNLFLYVCAVVLILIARPSYIPFLTLIIFISVFSSFLLSFKKSYPIKNVFPLLLILLIHSFYFYAGFERYLTKDLEDRSGALVHSQMPLASKEDREYFKELVQTRNELNIEKSNRESFKELVQTSNELNIEKSIEAYKFDKAYISKSDPAYKLAEKLIDDVDKVVSKELKKINKDVGSLRDNNSEIMNFLAMQKNNLEIKFIGFFAELRHRKLSNLIAAPNATFNYNSVSGIFDSKIKVIMSHIPNTIFAPKFVQIIDMNSSRPVKLIFLIETFINYILTFSVFYFLLKQKLYSLFFTIIIFSSMYITNLFDTNYGTYLRHAYIFNKLLLSMGFLGVLYFIKPNININIKKGFL
jgi:hypothetical protein